MPTAEAIAAKIQNLPVEDQLTLAAALARRGDLGMARTVAQHAVTAIDGHQLLNLPLPGVKAGK